MRFWEAAGALPIERLLLVRLLLPLRDNRPVEITKASIKLAVNRGKGNKVTREGSDAYGEHSKNGFFFPFWNQRFSPHKVPIRLLRL